MSEAFGYREDCRHYVGEKPCKYKCEGGCQHFEPFGRRILILKLGAIGDVLRTTPVLRVLKERYPQSHITWLVEDAGAPLLRDNPLVNKVLTPSLATLARLQNEQFDELYCLDKVDLATGLAMQVQAGEKHGFSMNAFGTLAVFEEQTEYARMLGMSDEEKFRRNQKPYQQIIFESLGWEYCAEQHEYVFHLNSGEVSYARDFFEKHGLQAPVVGINTGAGNVFAGKAWKTHHLVELCRRIHAELGAKVLLLGGPQEGERNQHIAAQAGDAVVDAGTDNSLPRFAALVNGCDVIVSGDTTCMHLAIALGKRTVILFGATCAQEIDLYGRGEKIVAQIECAPCYLKAGTCPIEERCMEEISPDQVLAAVQRQLAYLPAPTLP